MERSTNKFVKRRLCPHLGEGRATTNTISATRANAKTIETLKQGWRQCIPYFIKSKI